MTDSSINIGNNPNNLHIRDLCIFFESKREDLKRTVNRTLDQRLRGRLDASDVLQETLIEAIRTLDTFQATRPMPLFDWLRFLVKNTAKNANVFHLSTQKRSVKTERNNEKFLTQETAGQSSPSHRAIKKELLNKKKSCLNHMSAEENEILRLRHERGLRNDEVASRLGISAKAASKRYYRAVEKLSRLMDWSSTST